METTSAEKRKSPEPEREEKKDVETKDEPKETPTVASSEPPAKKAKLAVDPAALKKQVEYYLSDDNLKYDKFFHEKITTNAEGWLDMSLVLSCNKMKALKASKEEVVAALATSTLEIRGDGDAIRRPSNAKLPELEARPQKKQSANAHAGGPVVVCRGVPAEQSWVQVKEAIKAKVPAKAAIWHVSEVNDNSQCYIVTSPFANDLAFFETCELELGGAKLKLEVAQGDVLQKALKQLPKNIKDKREKQARQRQKEKNRPIIVGNQKFMNVSSLRGRVKEILNSRTDGEVLKPDGSDYKLIRAVLNFHPAGEKKYGGLKGIKVAKSTQGTGETRCFFMIKDSGDEDFSAKKCLDAIDANPPYAQMEPKEKKAEAKAPAASAEAKEKTEEKKDQAKGEAAKPEEVKSEEAKPKAKATEEAAATEAKEQPKADGAPKSEAAEATT